MPVYLEVSTNCDDEQYDSAGSHGVGANSQQNLLSLQSIASVSACDDDDVVLCDDDLRS